MFAQLLNSGLYKNSSSASNDINSSVLPEPKKIKSSSVSSEPTSNIIKLEESIEPPSPTNTNINSPFEFNSSFEFDILQEGLSVVMIFFCIGMFYPYLSLTINLLVNELDLKNKSFIKNSVRLSKIVSYFEKTSKFYRFLMLFLIGINLIGMIMAVYVLYTSYL